MTDITHGYLWNINEEILHPSEYTVMIIFHKNNIGVYASKNWKTNN